MTDATDELTRHLAKTRDALLEAVGLESPIGAFWLGPTVSSSGEISGLAQTIGHYLHALEAALGPEQTKAISHRFTATHIMTVLWPERSPHSPA